MYHHVHSVLYYSMFTFVLLCVQVKMKKKVEELQVNTASLTLTVQHNYVNHVLSVVLHVINSVVIVCTG